MSLRLNLGAYLEQHKVTPYRLVRESGLATNTVYDLARRPAQRVDLETVSRVLGALERITGEPVAITDLLEGVAVRESGPNPTSPVVGNALSPEIAALLEKARGTVKVRPARALPPGEHFTLPEPVELDGEGPSTSEVVVQLRDSGVY